MRSRGEVLFRELSLAFPVEALDSRRGNDFTLTPEVVELLRPPAAAVLETLAAVVALTGDDDADLATRSAGTGFKVEGGRNRLRGRSGDAERILAAEIHPDDGVVVVFVAAIKEIFPREGLRVVGQGGGANVIELVGVGGIEGKERDRALADDVVGVRLLPSSGLAVLN